MHARTHAHVHARTRASTHTHTHTQSINQSIHPLQLMTPPSGHTSSRLFCSSGFCSMRMPCSLRYVHRNKDRFWMKFCSSSLPFLYASRMFVVSGSICEQRSKGTHARYVQTLSIHIINYFFSLITTSNMHTSHIFVCLFVCLFYYQN